MVTNLLIGFVALGQRSADEYCTFKVLYYGKFNKVENPLNKHKK